MPGKGAGGPPGGLPTPEVEVIVTSAGSATITQELPGRLQAVRTAQVRARVEGIIEKRMFTEGSDVIEGTPLFRIDPRNYQAAFDAARADQALARLTVERYKPLLAINAVSKQEFDLAEARLKQADAALTRTRVDLENTTVPAPISGRIGREQVTEGALVGRGEATLLATIEALDPIYVNFTQSGADALRLQKSFASGKLKSAGQARIDLILEDNSIYSRAGRLIFKDLAVDPTTGSVSLRAEFPNPKRELLPGTFVRVRFPEALAEGVILVPQRAVQIGPQGQFVTVVDESGKAAVTPVKTSGMSGKDFVIAEGLKGGEKIIVNGLQKARPGTPVRPLVLGPDGKPIPVPKDEAAQTKPADQKGQPIEAPSAVKAIQKPSANNVQPPKAEEKK
ncbi:MAG: efflux RND transporter periplasmic adaptor subunit [Burkholderiaceae bacterium]|nr:efflux RND transporter periplasmic adaptor subunit [Burkholderiaceae bacterium]